MLQFSIETTTREYYLSITIFRSSRFNELHYKKLRRFFGFRITLALGEGGELEFLLPGPSARKETEFLRNHNVSRSTKSVAKCCGE